MRKNILVAGIAVAALLPSLAMAQETCEQRSANRTAGTVVGAVAGALVGSAVAGHGEKGAGAAIGGVGGAIAGNQLARGDRDCTHAYGFYDSDGRWHANQAVAVNERAAPSGYYDTDRRWHPAGEGAVASGYYDNERRWHPAGERTVATGYYDRNGDWIDGQPNGYYDSRGQWVARSAGGYGRDASYEARASTWEVDTQISRIDDRIRRGRGDGSLSRRESWNASQTLGDIRREERNEMRDGRLSLNEQTKLQGRLDALSDDIRLDRQN
jgi:hypothetical protein